MADPTGSSSNAISLKVMCGPVVVADGDCWLSGSAGQYPEVKLDKVLRAGPLNKLGSGFCQRMTPDKIRQVVASTPHTSPARGFALYQLQAPPHAMPRAQVCPRGWNVLACRRASLSRGFGVAVDNQSALRRMRPTSVATVEPSRQLGGAFVRRERAVVVGGCLSLNSVHSASL